jgi:anti-sigma regulatory factor (Ser/Thr protein kinase)
MKVTAAIPVTETTQVAEGRRLALWLAGRLGFSAERGGQAALIATELGTNLAKHARAGELLIRPLAAPDGEAGGIEVLALDKGPGMPEAAARRDGYSTAGTLGNGLGAIDRQSDHLDLYTHPTGTVIAAQIWRERPAPNAPRPRFDIGAVHVSKTGEEVCGDDWSWRQRDGRLALIVADGLGHGLQAHDASAAATRLFAAEHELSPGRVIGDVHAALRPTRGAAVAMLAVDVDRRTGAFAGLGNITGMVLLPGGGRHNLVSHNGTAGHSAARIQEFNYPVPPQAIIVVFSDGLSTRWDLSPYPGLTQRSPSLMAGVLYRDFSRRRDDVTVVVARERRPVAEKL